MLRWGLTGTMIFRYVLPDWSLDNFSSLRMMTKQQVPVSIKY